MGIAQLNIDDNEAASTPNDDHVEAPASVPVTAVTVPPTRSTTKVKSIEAKPASAAVAKARPKTLFIHEIPESGKGGVTIAYQYKEDLQMYVIGVARCSELDNYDRKIGRAISTASLLRRPIFIPDEIRTYPDWIKMEVTYILQYLQQALRRALV